MALDSYAALKTSILGWLARPGDPLVEPAVPDMIRLFEHEATRRLKVAGAEKRASLTAVSSAVLLPDDFGELRLATTGGVGLTYVPPMQLPDGGGNPQHYTIVGNELRLGPGPDSQCTIEIIYQSGVPPLSDSNPSNWLLLQHPDCYLFGALVEAEGYIGHDERIQLWAARREAVFQSIEQHDRKQRWNGAPLLIRADGITAGGGSAAGDWTSAPPVLIPITSVVAGEGLVGGGSSGPVTIALDTPVAIVNGGTNATTASQALLNLGGAPLASPVFTGVPQAPTPAPGDDSQALATTEYVSGELVAYAPLNSPTLTGDPKAPTPAPGDNDTTIATTAYVQAALVAGGGITQLTGAVTAGPGAGSQAAAIADNAVTTTKIINSAVTYAKVQNVVAARLLGNPTGSAAAPGEISLGTGLSFAGSVLNAAAGGGSGTVTSITAGTGVTLTPSPITATGSVALTVPVVVSSGGTGTASLTQYNTLVGNGTAAVSLIVPGANGTIYASNGAAAMPSFRGLSALVDVLAGTPAQGQILYRNNVAWTPLAPGTAGQFLQTAGAAANVAWAAVNLANTASITGTLPVANGGTGSATAAAALTSLGAVARAGDTMSGALTMQAAIHVSPVSGPATVNLTSTGATDANTITGYKVGNPRWQINPGDGVTEAAGDVGSNFGIHRFANAGTYLGAALTITRSNGACACTSGTWTSLSDADLKQDVVPYNRGLSAITALEPVAFRYKPGTPFTSKEAPSEVQYGLIAQQVQPHIPEIVGNMSVMVNEREQEVDTLNAGQLIFSLINAVKELAAEVAALKADKPA